MQITIKRLGLKDYETVWREMQVFTEKRDKQTEDQIWVVEHPSVFTLGLNGKLEHILAKPDIPIINTDRGGQVTFHGPGQLVVYLLLDLQRLDIGVRSVITMLEQAMINTLSQYGVTAVAKAEAPGVYVDDKKIGSVGLRVKRGCSYHGLSLNNDMDLSPFNCINTCGYADLEVTRLADLNIKINTSELAVPVVHQILQMIKK